MYRAKEISMGLIDNKTAVVTGGSKGIGLATAARRVFVDGGTVQV
jgi:NAD(P)-dependent dehydrogenase (short-subunit alcohol dehydrogenase family)